MILQTPTDFDYAGGLLDNVFWTDRELEMVIAGLECVIPWLEGAGYSRRITGPLDREYRRFKEVQQEREITVFYISGIPAYKDKNENPN